MYKFFLILFLCVFFVPVLYAVPTSGLQGLWSFNGNAYDSSGYGNNGSINGATLSMDRFGNANSAYNFDGNDYIRIGKPIPTNLQMTTAFSISAWVKPTGIGTGVVGGIVASQYDPAQKGYSMQVEYRSSAHGGIQKGVHFQVGAGSYWTNGSEGSTATTLQWNQWNHVVVMAQVNSVYQVYINNVLVTNWTAEGNIAYDNNCDLLFGANSFNGAVDRYFIGSIDDVAIYNKVLSTTEISQLYTEVVPEPNVFLLCVLGLFLGKYFFGKILK